MKSEEKKKALKQHLGKHTNKEKTKKKKQRRQRNKNTSYGKKKEKHGFFFFSICRAAPKKIWKLCKE